MCRCKACDKPLDEHEIIWNEDLAQWEDLCKVCIEIALSLLGSDGYLSDERAVQLSRKAAAKYAVAFERMEKS